MKRYDLVGAGRQLTEEQIANARADVARGVPKEEVMTALGCGRSTLLHLLAGAEK